jgi:dihydrofolate reductase
MLRAADALLMGRATFEGLAAVWPQLAEVPGYETYAARVNAMPKYVASRTLTGPLEWNAGLLEGEVADSVPALKERHAGNLVVTGCGELARDLIDRGLVDELWFWVSPAIWPGGPRILDGMPHIRLELAGATTFSSGVVRLSYRLPPAAG